MVAKSDDSLNYTNTANHQQTNSLIRAKDAMQSVVDSMRDFTCLLTHDGLILWGNKAASRWLGIDHDILLDVPLWPIFPHDSWDLFKSAMHSSVKATSPLPNSSPLTDRSSITSSVEAQVEEMWSDLSHLSIPVVIHGQLRDILWDVQPFRAISSRRGQVYLVVGRDITEALRAKSAQAMLQGEIETAQFLQASFFPANNLSDEHIEVASYYMPAANCSGDVWSYFDLGLSRKLICIADVTGHGVASALVTAMSHALCTSFAAQVRDGLAEASPAALIRELNSVLFKTFKSEMYQTFFAFIFDHSTNKAHYSVAGHNPPLFLRLEDGHYLKPNQIVHTPANPIGFDSDTEYSDEVMTIEKGDRFVLYTDGLTECRNPNGRQFGGGLRRSVLKHCNEPLEDLRNGIVKDAFDFFSHEPLTDDITLVTVEIRSAPAAVPVIDRG
ncbi:MAG: hypothetical protein EOP10_09490 [Proteobacteria bacterium]|nr:MAG: hypothetical protein EOP10_09490 [Pseudomonadota bacterium]